MTLPAPFRRGAGARGSETWNVPPSPGGPATGTVPPRASTRAYHADGATPPPAGRYRPPAEALSRRASVEPVEGELVERRYCGGSLVEAVAGVANLSRGPGERYWCFARVWI